MKKSKKNYVIVALVVILLALAIGYASFSGTLKINGTAKGNATWNVQFTSARFLDKDGEVDTAHGTAPVISKATNDGDTITANVTLAYPGDGVILEAVVTNSGTLPAKLTGFTVTGADDDLLITPASPSENEVVAANGGTCTTQFFVKWATNSTATSLNKTFTVTYEYVQDTTEINATPSHT